MTTLARVTVEWTGWDGAPGVNILHFSPGSTSSWSEEVVEGLVEEVTAAYTAMQQLWFASVTAEVLPTVRLIDDDSGTLTGIVVSPTAPGLIAGTGSGTYLSRATMCTVRLLTSDFVRGRQLRGRIFIGPIAEGALSSEGVIASTVPDIVTDAWEASISGLGPRLAVWSRPVGNASTGGSYGDVTTVGVMPKPGILRSRRD